MLRLANVAKGEAQLGVHGDFPVQQLQEWFCGGNLCIQKAYHRIANL